MRPRSHSNTRIYSKSEIYKLTCQTCILAYIGQTRGNLMQPYQEHIHYVRNNDPQPAYAYHILSNQHEYGNINEIITLIKPIQKSSMLIPYEQFFIHSYPQHKTTYHGKQLRQAESTISTGHWRNIHVTWRYQQINTRLTIYIV
jgi:hypothetical protein